MMRTLTLQGYSLAGECSNRVPYTLTPDSTHQSITWFSRCVWAWKSLEFKVQSCKIYRHWELWKKVTGSEESSFTYILDKCENACVVYTSRKVPAWCLALTIRGVWWPCNIVEGILAAWFGSTCTLKKKSHCKSKQSCFEWLPLS